VDFRRSASEQISLEADVTAPHAFDPAPKSPKTRRRSWAALGMGQTALFIKLLIVVQVTKTRSRQTSDFVTSITGRRIVDLGVMTKRKAI
jgi:hypothetical protein